ncbi:MAG TPA: 2-dehydropantoate 2-reductase N-terminal domain-containing protein [Acidimicrobiales bacterium]|nr:2-dehydropantoate 2-reductase N-terminal domain-containing protein [Acidimicrobiales bacterium]
MRFVMLGAGAVGGVVGGRLFEHGHDVVLVARGDHAQVIARHGLTLASASGVRNLHVPVVERLEELDWRGDEVVLLAVKSQDTEEALRELAGAVASSVPVVCVQNGVANEAAALRRFAHVYGVCVMCPASHLEAGVVVAESSPVTALLDVGRYPEGSDATAAGIAAAFEASTIRSVVRGDIMRWKYAKLLRNLGNAVDALCGPAGRSSQVTALARAEGEACLGAAAIAYVSDEEDSARRDHLLHPTDVVGFERGGSSTWQSLARNQGSAEVDYLNGEIVLLGRLYGVPTPVNELLQRLVNQNALAHAAPGRMTPEEVLALLHVPPQDDVFPVH